MAAAQRAELRDEKSGRTGGRVNQALVEQAKARPRIEADADLFDFALANIALDDAFAETFKALRGPVDPDLKLGFWGGGVRCRGRSPLGASLGVLDPEDAGTAAVADAVAGRIRAMPETLLFTPDAEILGRGPLLADILSRLLG